MIPPTIGRKVWYHPSQEDLNEGAVQFTQNQPLDATIVYVWNDNSVNLLVIDHHGNGWRKSSVAINNTEGAAAWAEWLPDLFGQAKKEENKA